ncbi:MAG TPA: ComF family protein [Gammaproteobacteria bacterium]|nr:ComF family protein [Gammaproteobacteria bacterium]
MTLKKLFAYVLPYTCIVCQQKSDRPQDLCEGCLQHLPFHREENSGALLRYETPIAELILALKFQQKLAHARVFGELLAEKCQQYYENNPLPEAIFPIPLHPARLKERGFNQALEIARPVARLLGIPLQTKNVYRVAPTLPQATLPKTKRPSNVAKAFCVDTTYSHVAVIDDVFTTGNTMEEFCRTLQTAGVKTIDTWCVAKTKL